jgi:hypothetical protein
VAKDAPVKRERYNNGAERSAVYANTDVLKLEQKRLGPPMQYNEKVFNSILEQVSKGGKISVICDGTPPYPSYRSWFRWLVGSPELRQRYAQARHMLVERYADEIVMIADGELPLTDTDEPPNPQRDRLRIDARRWVMGKLNPAFWGDRDKPALPPPDDADEQRTIIDVRSLDPATRRALKATLLAIEEAERNGDK